MPATCILAGESIDRVKAKLPQIGHGVFAENIVTRGVDLAGIAVGDRFHIGEEILLEVTQIGDCIMPREGLFCKVLHGGTVTPGNPIELESRQASAQSA